jgi:hypothetical protein
LGIFGISFFTTNLQAGIVTVYDVAKGNTASSGSSSIYFGNTFSTQSNASNISSISLY